MKLKTNVSVEEAFIENLPSKSVCVPILVPLTLVMVDQVVTKDQPTLALPLVVVTTDPHTPVVIPRDILHPTAAHRLLPCRAWVIRYLKTKKVTQYMIW